MIIPVRCFTCGKPIGHLWEEYQEKLQKGEEAKKVMDKLGLERYCCRATFLSHVDMSNEAGRFRKF